MADQAVRYRPFATVGRTRIAPPGARYSSYPLYLQPLSHTYVSAGPRAQPSRVVVQGPEHVKFVSRSPLFYGMAYFTDTRGDLSSPVGSTFLCLMYTSYCEKNRTKEEGREQRARRSRYIRAHSCLP